MLLKHDVAHKETDRLGLSSAVDNFLANGGKINVIERPVVRKDQPHIIDYKEAQAARMTKQNELAHMRKQRARIHSLRGCGVSDREIMQRMEISHREFKRLLG